MTHVSGFLLSNGNRRAFVIAEPHREEAARARFKEWFGKDADPAWDNSWEWAHYVITAQDEDTKNPDPGHVELLDTWVDDHILCCRVKIGTEEIQLWWCGWEGVAAATYANESRTAWETLMGMVEAQKKSDVEDAKDIEEEKGEPE